tara:strand:- start:43 stop:399 length:357 start_codon:yes stop_codon:yes gene_type:complete
MNIYYLTNVDDTFPGLKEMKIEVPPPEELLEAHDMIGDRNPAYGGVGPNRGLFGKNHPRWGKKGSQKQKDAMSKARKGSKHSDEAKAKMKLAWVKRRKTFISPFKEYHKYKKEDKTNK